MFPHTFSQENLLRYKRHFAESPSRLDFSLKNILRQFESNKLARHCQCTLRHKRVASRSRKLSIRAVPCLSLTTWQGIAFSPSNSRSKLPFLDSQTAENHSRPCSSLIS